MSADLLVSMRGVEIDYRGLRPLRVAQLDVRRGEILALLGFDRGAAQVLVDLISGAALPDAGEIVVFGRPTGSITESDSWLRELDRFGIISERMVLLDQLTAEQNLAMPFSLDLDDLSSAIRARVHALADEVGIVTEELPRFVSELPPSTRMRIRLAKAIALNPELLLAEHPQALVPAEELPVFAADFSRVVANRGLGALVTTADATFAASIASRVLALQPATGALAASSGWRRWWRPSRP
jgi:putative ABC transport system ATP-binding protein